MTQQPTLDQIQKQHQELLRQLMEIDDVDLDAPQVKAFLEGVRGFLNTLAQAGTYTENSEQRSLLRDFIRYWSSILNKKTGDFPNVQLQPFAKRSNVNFFGIPIRYYLITLITIILLSSIIVFILLKSTTTLPNTTSLTPQEVQTWCSTIPGSNGTCNPNRFEQLVTNGHVNPKAVLMKEGGGPVSFNIPAGITVDVWNCKEKSTVPGPKKLNLVCQATFYLTLSSALRMKASIQFFYLSSFYTSLGALTKSGAERLENR